MTTLLAATGDDYRLHDLILFFWQALIFLPLAALALKCAVWIFNKTPTSRRRRRFKKPQPTESSVDLLAPNDELSANPFAAPRTDSTVVKPVEPTAVPSPGFLKGIGLALVDVVLSFVAWRGADFVLTSTLGTDRDVGYVMWLLVFPLCHFGFGIPLRRYLLPTHSWRSALAIKLVEDALLILICLVQSFAVNELYFRLAALWYHD